MSGKAIRSGIGAALHQPALLSTTCGRKPPAPGWRRIYYLLLVLPHHRYDELRVTRAPALPARERCDRHVTGLSESVTTLS